MGFFDFFKSTPARTEVWQTVALADKPSTGMAVANATAQLNKLREIEVPPPPDASLAPWPTIDRFPVILGSNVTIAYISSVFRTCLTGYRREFCDLLDELLERDPHLYGVTAQRIHAVTGGELQVITAKTPNKPDGSVSDEDDKAREIAAYIERRLRAIPDWQQAISQLQWGGLYYGVGASEVTWSQDADGWFPARLHWIHSRRLNYPDQNTWDLHVWDQGSVRSTYATDDPTSRMFGISVKNFPGKFIVHTPSVRGNYPTRDGLGRECAYWSALKLMGARGAAQYIERFGKPWVVGYYSTAEEEKMHRAADERDMKVLDEASRALGTGNLASATLPDSTKLDIFGPAAAASARNLLHGQFINICNAEMSKAVLGQTDTTEPSSNGSKGAVEVRKQGTQELYRYDAACLADTLQNTLVKWMVQLTFPGFEHLAPTLRLHSDEEPDPNAILERACKMASFGAPVDADKVAEEVGVPLLPKPDYAAMEKLRDAVDEADDANEKATFEAAGVPYVKTKRPPRVPIPTGRPLYPMMQMKPFEAQEFGKMIRSEPLTTPPKILPPTSEGGGGTPAGGLHGVQGAPVKNKPGPAATQNGPSGTSKSNT